MESNKKYIKDWELAYNLFSKQYRDKALDLYWPGDNTHTETHFFSFGFITFTVKDNITQTPYIRNVYILNQFRNQKIGFDIVSQLLKNYKQQGYKKVSVEPTIESVLFWKKLGFKKGNKNKFFIDLCN